MVVLRCTLTACFLFLGGVTAGFGNPALTCGPMQAKEVTDAYTSNAMSSPAHSFEFSLDVPVPNGEVPLVVTYFYRQDGRLLRIISTAKNDQIAERHFVFYLGTDGYSRLLTNYKAPTDNNLTIYVSVFYSNNRLAFVQE